MPTAHATAADRARLQARLAEARAVTDDLFDRLRADALYERPIPERHRMIFYLGHLEAFDWNLIAVRSAGVPSFEPRFDKLFAFGIDPVDGGLPSEPASEWPSAAEVAEYNQRTRKSVDEIVAEADLSSGAFADGTVIHVGIEHRLMHAETLAYLLHRLPTDRKEAPAAPPPLPPPVVRPGAVKIPAGRATLGIARGSGRFGWDNEFERHTVDVPAFSIDRHNVTNGEFLEFLHAGGYREPRYWSDADWQWRERERVEHPGFWLRREDGWYLRDMFAEVQLPLDAPVYVSQAEASAYARWKGGRLPTEAEFHRAAYGTPEGTEREYPWGDEEPGERHGNFDFRRWDPAPVGSFPEGDSAFGVSDLVGNGWEWTSTVFGPFEGFAAFPFYPGYSANFFDGKHYVIKGGSSRTAACMLRRSFRNWFQGHYPYIYTAFRVVRR